MTSQSDPMLRNLLSRLATAAGVAPDSVSGADGDEAALGERIGALLSLLRLPARSPRDAARVLGEMPDASDSQLLAALAAATAARGPRGQKSLQELLDQWHETVRSEPEWNCIPFGTASRLRFTLEDLWVELALVDQVDLVARAGDDEADEPGAATYGVASRARWHGGAALSRSAFLRDLKPASLTVVAGDPGGGKSTLARRLVRDVAMRKAWDFEVAILVPLREWAVTPGISDPMSLLRWFFGQRGQVPRRASSSAKAFLKRPAADLDRVLLLLDGWDEVTDRRDEALAAIRTQCESFTTLLFSRPSGIPQLFRPAATYLLARLSDAAVAHAIGRYFAAAGRPQLADAVYAAVTASAYLRDLTRNPFLLHLLCRLVDSGRVDPGTLAATGRAGFYRQGVQLIQDDFRNEKAGVVRDRDLTRLRKLAADRTFRRPGPEFYFRRGSLPRSLQRVLSGLCEKARLITTDRGTAAGTRGYFLHATLQEFFAAEALADGPPEHLVATAREFALSRPWENTFQFVAGLASGVAAEGLWQVFEGELKAPDRHGLVVVGVARCLAQLPLTDPHRRRLEAPLADRLWHILDQEVTPSGWNEELVRLVVSALLDLDFAATLQRLREWSASDPNQRRAALVAEVLGLAVDTRGLPDQWAAVDRDWVREQLAETRKLLTPESRQLKLQWQVERRVPLADLYRIREAVGGLDDWIVGELAAVVADPDERNAWLLDAIECLGGVATPRCAAVLTDFLLNTSNQERLRQAFAASWDRGKTRSRDMLGDLGFSPMGALGSVKDQLAHRWSLVETALRRAMGPESRDRLLGEVAVRAAHDPALPRILRVLAGMPITRGVGALVRLAGSAEHDSIRRLAMNALENARSPELDSFLEALVKPEGEPTLLQNLALEILVKRIPHDDGATLAGVVDSPWPVGIRCRALAMLARSIVRQPDERVAFLARTTVVNRLAEVLEAPDTDEEWAHAVVLSTVHAGPATVDDLLQLAASTRHEENLRIVACRALGEIGHDSAVAGLTSLAGCVAAADWQPADRVAAAALDALAKIDPVRLIGNPDAHSARILKAQCIRRQWRLYDDRIITDTGRILTTPPLMAAPNMPLTDQDWEFLDSVFGGLRLPRPERVPWVDAIDVDWNTPTWTFVEETISHPSFAISVHRTLRSEKRSESLKKHVTKLKHLVQDEAVRQKLQVILDTLNAPPGQPAPPAMAALQPSAPSAPAPAAVQRPVPAARPVGRVIVVLATGWGPSYGGINSFNMDFCLALARVTPRSRVVCLTKGVDHLTSARLKSSGIHVLSLPDLGPGDADPVAVAADAQELLKREGVDRVGLVFGHDVITGREAVELAKRMKGHSALFHHMSYIRYQAVKKTGLNAFQMQARQREVLGSADHVLAVGPLLRESAEEILRRRDVAMVVPGLAEIPAGANGKPRAFRAIAFGRMGGEDDPIKQGSLAVAGYGRFVARSDATRDWDRRFTMFGLPQEDYPREEQAIKALMAAEAGRQVTVNAMPYLENREELLRELAGHEVAFMLSWHEGFGLVGWEAIAAGVPLITSRQTGLFKLLNEDPGTLGADCVTVVDVLGSTGGRPDTRDVDAVATALVDLSTNFDAAFAKAAKLREWLKAKYSWDECARTALAACGWDPDGPASGPPMPQAPAPAPAGATPAVPAPTAQPTRLTLIQFVAGDGGGGSRHAASTIEQQKAIVRAREGRRHQDRFEDARPIFDAKIDDLIDCRRACPDILHFAGHGEEHRLLLAAEPFQAAAALTPGQLDGLFGTFVPPVRLLLLIACHTQDAARLLVENNRVAMAVGAAGRVSDDHALNFTRTFYAQLADGVAVQEAFQLAALHFPEAASQLVLVHADGVNPAREFFAGRNA